MTEVRREARRAALLRRVTEAMMNSGMMEQGRDGAGGRKNRVAEKPGRDERIEKRKSPSKKGAGRKNRPAVTSSETGTETGGVGQWSWGGSGHGSVPPAPEGTIHGYVVGCRSVAVAVSQRQVTGRIYRGGRLLQGFTGDSARPLGSWGRRWGRLLGARSPGNL